MLAAALVVLTAASLLCSQPAGALVGAPLAAPSDPRATFVPGNVSTCAQAGFPEAIQMGSPSNTDAADPNVAGVVAPHAAGGEEANIALLNGDAVIDAVIVKGGPAHNVYSNPEFLPRTLPAPQHYISPMTGGGQIPSISHWFVCYHLPAPPPVGSISVTKTVIGLPGGLLLRTPPAAYSALVQCDNQAAATVTFGPGGGEGLPSPALTGLPAGTVCTVVEQSPPIGATVTYNPPGADTAGVAIADQSGIQVEITNDYSADPAATGTLQLEKVVMNPPGQAAAADFTVDLLCNDPIGTSGPVTLPGSGGIGSPILHPQVNFACALEEASVPAGWTVAYSVDGGPLTTVTPVIVSIADTTAVTVTITNTGPATTAPAPPTTAPLATTAPAGSIAPAPALAATGSRSSFPLAAGVLAIVAGAALVHASKPREPFSRVRGRPGRHG